MNDHAKRNLTRGALSRAKKKEVRQRENVPIPCGLRGKRFLCDVGYVSRGPSWRGIPRRRFSWSVHCSQCRPGFYNGAWNSSQLHVPSKPFFPSSRPSLLWSTGYLAGLLVSLLRLRLLSLGYFLFGLRTGQRV